MMSAMRSYEAAQRMVQLNDSILERSVNDIVAVLAMRQPQVSKHLRVLREVGLVSARTDRGNYDGKTTGMVGWQQSTYQPGVQYSGLTWNSINSSIPLIGASDWSGPNTRVGPSISIR